MIRSTQNTPKEWHRAECRCEWLGPWTNNYARAAADLYCHLRDACPTTASIRSNYDSTLGHVCIVKEHPEAGFRPICSCGWKGEPSSVEPWAYRTAREHERRTGHKVHDPIAIAIEEHAETGVKLDADSVREALSE